MASIDFIYWSSIHLTLYLNNNVSFIHRIVSTIVTITSLQLFNYSHWNRPLNHTKKHNVKIDAIQYWFPLNNMNSAPSVCPFTLSREQILVKRYKFDDINTFFLSSSHFLLCSSTIRAEDISFISTIAIQYRVWHKQNISLQLFSKSRVQFVGVNLRQWICFYFFDISSH